MIGLTASLRAVLFHSVSDRRSDFTDGLGVTMTPPDFRDRIKFLRRRYHPVDLEAVAAAAAGERLPPRALLVTVDDAYASVADTMAGMLDDAGMPSVFFVNGDFIDHRHLGTDNLVTYTANTVGRRALQAAAIEVGNGEGVMSVDEALGAFVPKLDQGTLRNCGNPTPCAESPTDHSAERAPAEYRTRCEYRCATF